MSLQQLVTCYRVVVRGRADEELSSYYSFEPWRPELRSSHSYCEPAQVLVEEPVRLRRRPDGLTVLSRAGGPELSLTDALRCGWCRVIETIEPAAPELEPEPLSRVAA